MHTLLTDRHSGHHTQFGAEISKMSPELSGKAQREPVLSAIRCSAGLGIGFFLKFYL